MVNIQGMYILNLKLNYIRGRISSKICMSQSILITYLSFVIYFIFLNRLLLKTIFYVHLYVLLNIITTENNMFIKIW